MESKDNCKVLDAKHHSPADFPVEVLSKIFYGLMVPDLLNISMVCKSWCNVIATPKLLKSMRIRSDDKVHGRNLQKMRKMLKRTNRNYENIAIFHVNRQSIRLLNELGFKWKSLFLNGCTFKTSVSLLNLLKSVQETAESLHFDHMVYTCKYNDTIKETIVMPNLTGLTVDCIYCSDVGHILYVLSPNFHQLKSLKMAFNYFIERFMDYIPPEMRLTSLHLHQSSYNGNLQPIEAFLRSQKDCLKDVRLDSINSTIFQLIWNEFTVMTKLTIGNKRVELIAKELTLNQHPTLIELRFHIVVPNDVLCKIFEAVPNLKFLYVPEMDRELIVMATEKLLYLIFLHVWTLKGALTKDDKKFAQLKRAQVFQYIAEDDDEPLKRIKETIHQEQVKLLIKMLRDPGV
ncbi:unnamed protein product [Diamesa hyperborea]